MRGILALFLRGAVPCPGSWPGQSPWRELGAAEEPVPLSWVTRLSPTATPSRYLNHVKAFFYYISPCDFAWLHSNYQPCCSTRGFHCSLLLPFYGKWLIFTILMQILQRDNSLLSSCSSHSKVQNVFCGRERPQHIQGFMHF